MLTRRSHRRRPASGLEQQASPQLLQSYVQQQQMLAGRVTTLDIARSNGGLASSLVDELSILCPELSLFAAESGVGPSVEVQVLNGLPTVSFVRPGGGAFPSHAGTQMRLFQIANILGRVEIPTASLKRFKADARERELEVQTIGFARAATLSFCQQLWYGTQQNADDGLGFPGLIAQMPSASTHVVDAGGSTANTGSTIVMAYLAEDTMKLLWGEDDIFALRNWVIETVTNPDGSKLPALCNWLDAAGGFQLRNRMAIAQVKNVTQDVGHTATGDLLAACRAKFFANFKANPNRIFMSNRSIEDMRNSRKTALMPDPPYPTDWNGIPITVTGSLVDTEAIR